MSAPPALDVAAVHALLWYRAVDGMIRVVQLDLAAELGVSKYALNRTLAKMVEQGRLERLTPRGGSASVSYDVVDPDAWRG